MSKKNQKAIDKRVEQAYRATCSGVQINIMDIGKVFKVGRECIRDGVDEETLRATIRRYVETIRQNLGRFQMSESVTRYVITHVGTKGMRVLTYPAQGRYTYATRTDAEGSMRAILDTGVNGNDIPGLFGEQAVGTFEVRPVPCYPGHFDPKGIYFD